MLTKPIDNADARCEFCKDEPASVRFGLYGKWIGPDCIEDIRIIAREVPEEE